MGNFGRYYVSKLITDEDFRNKNLIILIALVSIFSLIITTIISLPSIIIEGVFGENMEDIEYMRLYQDSIIPLEEECRQWVKKQEEKYSSYDSVSIRYDFSLTWYDLVSIDAVRYKQDFSNVTKSDVEDIAKKFIYKDVKTETYRVTVTRKDKDGNDVEKEKTRRRAIITLETLSLEEVLEVCHIKDEENILLADNYVNVLTAMNIEGELNIYDDEIDLSDLKEYDAGFASLPYFNQTDVRWGRNAYGNSTIASGGCGPTALAMVISGLTNRTVTPSSVASWSVRNGHRAEGAGSYWSLMVDGGEHYGLKVKTVSRKKPNDILEALSEGMPVIASMGKGHFTNGGHFIVLIGVTDSGKILVYDPVSVNRSNQEWDLSIIMNESSRIGGVSGSPFWIFSTD